MIDFPLKIVQVWSTAAACSGLFMMQAAGAHPAAFTLNDLMQAPYPHDMIPAPTGSTVAWVFDAKSCRNIGVADPARGATARQITPYADCDGFNIDDLAWSPDGKLIAFTRGENLWDEIPASVESHSTEATLTAARWNPLQSRLSTSGAPLSCLCKRTTTAMYLTRQPNSSKTCGRATSTTK